MRPGTQGVLQNPQFIGSVLVSTQRPLQTSLGDRHWVQTLFTQVSLAPQTLPHMPQLRASWRGSRQPPLQAMVGRAQPAHIPFSQV